MVADIWMIGIILRGRGVLVYDGQTDRQMDICYSRVALATETSQNGLKVAKAGHKSEGCMGMMADRHDGMMA